MFDSDYDYWKGGGLFEFYFDISCGIRERRGSIWQELLHSIIGHNNDTNVNLRLLQAVPQMNYISDKKVAAGRNLNLDA